MSGVIETLVDPGNIFGKRSGGISASGLFDPGGEILESAGIKDAHQVADPGNFYTADNSMMGRIINPQAAIAADMADQPSIEPTPSVDTAAVQAAAAAARRRASGYSTQVSGQFSTPSIGTTTLLGR